MNSVARVFASVSCLLICLACATPFPVEELQEGMTTEAVRAEFGAPEAVDAYLCWSYVHEKQNWVSTLILSWGIPFVVAVCAAEGCEWTDFYVESNMVLLDFEEEKLVRWETIEPIEIGRECSRPLFAKEWNPNTGRYEDDPFPRETCVPVFGFPDPPYCTSIRRHWLPGAGEVTSDAIIPSKRFIPTGPRWVFDPSAGYPEPDTSCKSEGQAAEGHDEAGDMRYVARDYVSFWIEPHTRPLDAERVSLDRGQPLKILRRRCQWCRVEDDLGTIGWIACVFLDASK